jgi:hypothetical protein
MAMALDQPLLIVQAARFLQCPPVDRTVGDPNRMSN